MRSSALPAGVLALTFGFVALAAADDRDPKKFTGDDQGVPTVIQPPRNGTADRPVRTVPQRTAAAKPASATNESDASATPPDADTANTPPSAEPARPRRMPPYGVPGLIGYDDPFAPWGYWDSFILRPSQQSLLDAYETGRREERDDRERQFNERDMAQRKERLLNAHDRALRAGLEQLKRGAYTEAVIALTLASQLDQGDPACRIHLAQARVALGQYPEAAEVLRRALQLQPKLALLPLHLEKYYESPEGLTEQVADFGTSVRGRQATGEEYFLLGFLRMQIGEFKGAHAAFRAAARRMPKDELTQELLKVTLPPRRASR